MSHPTNQMIESRVKFPGRRLARASALFAGVLACLGACTLALYSCAQSMCWESGADSLSPSGRHLARVSSSGCGGIGGDNGLTFSVTLRIAGQSVSTGRDVFSEDMIGQKPDASWSGNDHLTITLKNVTNVHRSELTFRDVTISYKAPFDYSSEHFRELEDRYEHDVGEQIRNRTATFGGDLKQDEVWLRETVARSREFDKQFHDWAVQFVVP